MGDEIINLDKEKRLEKKYKDAFGVSSNSIAPDSITSDSIIHDAFDFDERLKRMKAKMADFDKELDSFKRRENSKIIDF